jgi:cobyrinic acid a,c-diamide synthase
MATITGSPPRHLDSWLMSPSACQAAFVRGARSADLSIVEGSFIACPHHAIGGQLPLLCDWLRLPRLGVLDGALLTACCLPQRPAVDALLLDRVRGLTEFYVWQTMVESLWGIPVIGAIEELPAVRCAIGALAPGAAPPRELGRALGDSLLRHLRPSQLLELTHRRPWTSVTPPIDAEADESPDSALEECQLAHTLPTPLTVAVAYDAAFSGYFPDTLDALEQCGVTVRDFSPLADEALPPATDIVYIGCGRPDLHAEELSGNYCLLSALREHACSGKRIYAEGGGLAYLCRHLATADGNVAEMAGVLPAVARANANVSEPQPVERTLVRDSWLGRRGRRVRGYLNDRWLIEPCCKQLCPCIAEPEGQLDLVERHQAIGSRIHLHLAAQPDLLDSFLRPSHPALDWAAM